MRQTATIYVFLHITTVKLLFTFDGPWFVSFEYINDVNWTSLHKVSFIQ